MLSNVNKIISPSRVLLQTGNMLTRSQLANFSTQGLEVNHDLINHQFFITMNSSKAVVDYEKKGNNITFLHTEVPDIFRGKGVAKILAKEIFSYSSTNNLKVRLECDFLKNYYESNKDQYRGLKVSY